MSDENAYVKFYMRRGQCYGKDSAGVKTKLPTTDCNDYKKAKELERKLNIQAKRSTTEAKEARKAYKARRKSNLKNGVKIVPSCYKNNPTKRDIGNCDNARKNAILFIVKKLKSTNAPSSAISNKLTKLIKLKKDRKILNISSVA